VARPRGPRDAAGLGVECGFERAFVLVFERILDRLFRAPPAPPWYWSVRLMKPSAPSEWQPVSPDRVSPTLFSRRKFWAEQFGTAPVLPTSRAEMDGLGWESCDVVLVTGDAYVDHPSFGAALIGRLLEAQGFRVGILAQPDWRQATSFARLGRPNLFWGVTARNMD
jgi:hypothetical protein